MFGVIPSDFMKLIRTDHLSAWAQVISADWVKKTYLSLPYNKERDERIYPLTWKESHIGVKINCREKKQRKTVVISLGVSQFENVNL